MLTPVLPLIISNQGLRFRRDLVDYDIYSCWDANISADGIVYLGPISQYSTDLQAKLIAYDYARDKSYLCCDSKHYTLAGPRQLPHKETHESITFLPDGKVALTTHSTAASADQPEWLPFSHLHHSWAGFPGSYILVYDPVTGQVENWGIPVARETIYGMTYDARYNCLYLIGFMKGHVYRFSIDDRTVTDLGKAAEYYCYRLHPGPDGHIYGMTKSGYLWRINVDTASLDDLNWRHPAYPGNAFNNAWYRYLAYARNVSAHEFVFCSYTSDEFYLFDTGNCQVRSLGPKFTHAQHNNVRPSNFCQNEFALDRYGALWYMIQPVSLEHKSADEPYYFTIPSYLIYWDIKNNRLPQNLGLVSDNRSLLSYATAVCYDKERDILHLVGGNIRLQDNYTTLGICSIDLVAFRPVKDEKGALCSYKPYQFSRKSPSEQESLRQKASASPYPLFIGEEFGKENPWQAFREDQVCPIRLWRYLPQGQLAAAAVIGMAWDQSGVLHGLCGAGQEPEFYFQITANDFTVSGKSLAEVSENPTSWLYQGILGPFQPQRRGKFLGIKPPPAFSYQLTDLRPFAELDHELKEWLAKSILPKSDLPLEQDWPLPAVAGRAYLAKASYWPTGMTPASLPAVRMAF